MARPLRVAVPEAWCHEMTRGIEGRTIYPGEGYYRKFEELFGGSAGTFWGEITYLCFDALVPCIES
jgi:hypothetical protein